MGGSLQERNVSDSSPGHSRLNRDRSGNDFLPGLLADYGDGTTVEPALSKPDIGSGPIEAKQLIRKRAGGIHHGQELQTPLKAEYIGADQTVIVRIRLQTSSGPYIPIMTLITPLPAF